MDINDIRRTIVKFMLKNDITVNLDRYKYGISLVLKAKYFELKIVSDNYNIKFEIYSKINHTWLTTLEKNTEDLTKTELENKLYSNLLFIMD